MNRQQLEGSADAIERVLYQHQTPARITGGHVTPRAVIFDVSPQSAESAARIEELSNTIAVALGVPHAKVTRSGGTVRIDVPRHDAQPVLLARMLSRIRADQVQPVTALLGLAEDGAPLMARFPSPDVGHMLITGAAGSGKTSLIVAMLLSLAFYNKPRDVRIILEGAGLACLSDLPHVLNTVDDAAALVDRRMANGSTTTPRVIVAIDDLDTVERSAVDTLIGKGARVGVHCIVAAREPIDLPVKVRITASRQPGDFWADYGGQVIRFDAAYIGGDDLAAFIQAIK
jgi:hypothetical protein